MHAHALVTSHISAWDIDLNDNLFLKVSVAWMYIFSIQTVDAFTMACKTEHPSEYISKNISLEIFQ